MRIGIAGAQGSGKSTLARALSGKYGLKLVDGVPRDVAKELKLDLTTIDTDTRINFQQEALSRQMARESLMGGDFVSSRTSLDYAAYMLAHVQGDLYPDIVADYVSVCLGYAAHNYDIILLTEPFEGSVITDDGVRNTDVAYQDLIHMYICMLMPLVGSSVIKAILPEDADRRLVLASDCVSTLKELTKRAKLTPVLKGGLV